MCEPTLHPEFLAILRELQRYAAQVPTGRIAVATHGHGDRVRSVLARRPPGIAVDDSAKDSAEPPFATFNVAPVDVPSYAAADFRNGCPFTSTCGIGLTPRGYYACALAGGIDRVFELGLGRDRLPSDGEIATFTGLADSPRAWRGATRPFTWRRKLFNPSSGEPSSYCQPTM